MTGCHCLGVTLRVTAERGRRRYPPEAGHPLTIDVLTNVKMFGKKLSDQALLMRSVSSRSYIILSITLIRN